MPGSTPPTLPSKDNSLVDAGIIAAAVLAILLVALSTLGRRRCRHPVVRFVVWGLSMVFLPLTSFIISSLLREVRDSKCDPMDPRCHRPKIRDMWTLLLWLVLILTIKGNADVAAAAVALSVASPTSGDVSVDGQRVRPAVELIAQYGFVAYLIVACLPLVGWVGTWRKVIFVAFAVLGLARVVLKMAAFWRASKSFSLGMNARLVAGYMEQLVANGNDNDKAALLVPRYIVMGERKSHVREDPQGYRIKSDALRPESHNHKESALVTLDRVWKLGGLLAERQQELRDLCLSYSLFKILRRRLSGYPLADAGSSEALEFVLRGMDSVGAGGAANADRVFRVLVDELWFASDFYYSPVPLCTFGGWCATLNYLCSILIIAGAIAVGWIYQSKTLIQSTPYKVISFVLLVAVLLLETWEIVSGVCSNWTKMSLLGHYIRHKSVWSRCSCIHAALGAVLRLRPARRWSDKIGQNSVLEPRRFRRRIAGLFTEMLYGDAGLMGSVKLSPAVKDAVLRSLLSSYGRLRGVGGGKVNWALYGSTKSRWACNGDGGVSNTELILMWHVGTRLFEMKSTSPSDDMIAASHLSYYCAYLVAAAPELLPDSAVWTKKRYEEVSKDVRAALGKNGGGSESTAGRYERLVAALSADTRDKALRRGAEIGRSLVKEYAEDEASACRILADFWSEMLLYIAPSENVKGHVEAMARGGEFVTLVWALLLHAGITTRPEAPGAAMV